MRLLKQLGVVAMVSAAGSRAVTAVNGNDWLTFVLGIATAALVMTVYRWVVRRSERRAPAEAALEGAVCAVLKGLLIGVVAFSGVMLNIAVNGGYRVAGWPEPEWPSRRRSWS